MAKQLERKLSHNPKIGPFLTPPFSNLSDRRWALFLNSTRCLQNGTAFTIYHGLQLTPSTMVFLKNCFLVPTTLSQHKLYEQGALMSKLDLSDAFRHILVCCEDWELLRSAWQIDIKSTLTTAYFVDAFLLFGVFIYLLGHLFGQFVLCSNICITLNCWFEAQTCVLFSLW